MGIKCLLLKKNENTNGSINLETPTKEDIQQMLESKNLADTYNDEYLDKMGLKVVEWLDEDEEARRPWMERNNQWLELACQVQKKKTYPWPDAANVKYPLLTTAAMQFAARSYPALVPGPNLVQGVVLGRDDTGQKFESAKRVGNHMSFQLLHKMEDWEEDMDRLCMMIPIMGCLFKKTYYDPLKKKNVSELVLPGELVIDYFARSVESANRKSHIFFKNNNEIRERVNKGLWKEIKELGDPETGQSYPDPTTQKTKDEIDGTREPKVTPATPHKFVECHCWWDLDEDGYEEPYIITVHYAKKKIVRIVPRFNVEDVEFELDEKTGKEKLVKITPTEFFTKFGFIPNPDGSIYDLGFGLLLGGINESVNTLTNQLLDSGTLNNLQAGFLGRGIRVRSGSSRFLPGEWKPVDFVGDDIKKHIFPLPTKEPSDVLFKLLETLVTSGKELASVAEIFVGKMPGQNTPATTTMATIEQGLKVFTAIHKRLYRALGKEYQKLFRLNSIHMEEQEYFTINEPQGPVGQTAYKEDYSPENISVKPNADPNVVSQSQKLMKVQSYGALLQLQTINPQEYTKRFLEAVEAENIAQLMNVQPQPNPEQQKIQMEMQAKQQEMQMKQEASKAELMLKAQVAQMEMQIKQMEAMMDQKDREQELRFKAAEAQMDQQIKMIEILQTKATAEQDVAANDVQHQQKIKQSEEKHQVALKQAKEKPKAPKGGAKK